MNFQLAGKLNQNKLSFNLLGPHNEDLYICANLTKTTKYKHMKASKISQEQYSEILELMLIDYDYMPVFIDDDIHIYQSSKQSKYGNHQLHFPMNQCFCEGIPFTVATLKGEERNSKKIAKVVNKILDSAFN